MKHSDRSDKKELIDLGEPYYTPSEYDHCLEELDRIGIYLGGDRATLWAFDQLPRTPTSIVDFGCGGGGFTMKLAKQYPDAQVMGYDISASAVKYARNKCQQKYPNLSNIHWIVPASTDLKYLPDQFDVITATLVCHHLSDEELINFLKFAYKKASQAIILNDLHRSLTASLGFGLLAPLLFRNRLIIQDGSLSIKRGFIRRDWISYLTAAEIPLERCSITWHWAFRWIIRIDTHEA